MSKESNTLQEKLENINSFRYFKNLMGLIFSLLRKIFRLFSSSNNNLLIISLHNIGDTVFTVFAVKEIIKKHINCNIYILSYRELSVIYSKNDINFNSIEVDKKNDIYKNRFPKINLIKKISKINPEIIYDLTGTSVSAIIIMSQMSRIKNGMNINLFSKVYDNFFQIKNTPHLIDRYLDVVNVKLSDNEKTFKINNNLNDPIMIYPFAGWNAKEWGIRNFIKLANELNKKYKVIFLLGDKDIPGDIKSEINSNIKVVYTKTLIELFEIIENTSCFISNDSGPLYIANMIGKPTFTVYGPTNPEFSLPYGENHKFIISNLPCSPEKNKQYCFTYGGVFCHAYLCMDTMSSNKILKEVQLFLTKITK